ncbi:hypothetical protein [Mesorhizobium sp. M0030]|uniref:hypothetical protein n=1 Tax=Mesorhizobium sp. M0030 TaxID=2956851 RepID=UPI00333C0483
MATTSVDQVTGYGETVAYKAPCRLATTGNITLSGLQLIDGSVTAADDRVLVKDQTDGRENGIYIASSGLWQRARDLDSNRDVTKGTRVSVTDGAVNIGTVWLVSTSNPIVVGTSVLAFVQEGSQVYQAILAPRNKGVFGQSNAVLKRTSALWTPSSLHRMWTNDNAHPETVTGDEEWALVTNDDTNEITCALTNESTNDQVPINQVVVGYGGVPISHFLGGQKLTWSTNTANTDPGAGGIKCNNANPALATFIYVSAIDRNGVDRSFDWTFLNISPNNQPLRIRNEAETVLAQYLVTGALTINSGWYAIPVGTYTGPGGLTNGLACRALGTATDLWEATKAHVPLALAAAGETILHEGHWRGCESDKGAPSWIPQDLAEFRARLETQDWWPVGTPLVIHGCTSSVQTADVQFDDVNVQLETFASQTPESCRFEYPAAWARDPWWSGGADFYYHMMPDGMVMQGMASELARQGYGIGLRYNTGVNRVTGTEYTGGLVAAQDGVVRGQNVARSLTDLFYNFLNHASNTIGRTVQASTNLAQIFAQAPAAGGLMGLLTSGMTSIISGVGTRISFKPGGVEKVYVDATGLIVPTGSTVYLGDAPATSNSAAHKGYVDGATIPISYLDTDGTLAANSDTKVASQKAVKTYMDGRIAAQDAMVHKGVIDGSANPNYPAADRGWTYRVSVAGKIGGASGIVVENGDLIICQTDGTASGTQAAVGAQWDVIQTNLDGAAIGPASSVSGNITTFSGTSGKIIQDSGVAVSIDGTMAANVDTKLPTEKAIRTYLVATYQAITAALTSWVAITRASGFDAFVAAPTSANLLALLTTKTGTGSNVFGTSPTLTTPAVTTRIEPDVDGSSDMGQASKRWANAWYKIGAVLTFGAETLTHSAGVLSWSSHFVATGLVSAAGGIFATGQAGFGYAAGVGGAVAQATSKATGVTLNKICGDITLNAAALAASTTVSFVLTDSSIAATDNCTINHISVGTFGAYTFNFRPAAGSATIDVRNVSLGSLSEAIVIRFTVVKSVNT